MAATSVHSPRAGAAGDGAARILANSVFRAIADIGGKLATAALFILLAREVGAEQYGIWTFALSFTILLTIPGSIGQDIVLTREVARDHGRLDEVFSDALASRTVLNLPVLVVALLVATAAGMNAHTRIVVALLGLGVIMDGLLHLVFAVFQAFERLGAVPVILITQRWSTTIGAFVALRLGAGITEVAAIYFLCGLGAFVLGIVLIARRLTRPRLAMTRWGWLRLIRAAAPIGVASLAFYILFRIDTTLLAIFRPVEDVGQYGAAYRLLETTLFVSWSVNAAVLPVLCRLTPTSDPTVGAVYERAMKLVLAITLPLAAGVVVLAEPVTLLLYGEEYRPAVSAVVLLAPAIVLYPVSMLSSSLLYAQGRARLVAYAYVAVLVENVIANLILIPRFSFDGAAAGTSSSELLVATCLLVASAPLHGRLHAPRILGGALLGACTSTAVMWALRDELAAALVLGPLTYVAVLLTVERLAFPEDFAMLGAFVARRAGRAS